MNKYLALDTECGGIGLDKSLLTAYLAILDENLNTVDYLYLFCCPDDGIYKVEGKAMEINGINLAQHDKFAKSYKECGTLLYDFLKKNKGDKQLKPLGHGVKFDCGRMTGDLVSQGSWDKFVSYRVLDTGTIAGFAIELGLLPVDMNAGLATLSKYFKVGVQPGTGHDAKQDVELSIGVYRELIKLFKNNMADVIPFYD